MGGLIDVKQVLVSFQRLDTKVVDSKVISVTGGGAFLLGQDIVAQGGAERIKAKAQTRRAVQ